MLRNKNIWILMTGEFIANLGMWVGIIGNLEFLQKLVPSDFHKSLILFVGLFIGVLFGPMAGRIIDRTSKKKVMIYAGLARILAVMFMFVAIWTEQVLWMSVYMLVLGISAAFYFPALQAAIPLIAKDEQLMSLNGLHMNVGTIARIIGTALAGMLLLYISLFNMYFLTLLSYVLIFVCTLMLNIKEDLPKQSTAKSSKQKGGFKEVWPVIKSNPPVLLGLVLMLVPTMFIGSFNLMVLKISEMQHDPTIKGWLYTTEGISFMIGAFFIKRFSPGRDSVKILMICAAGIAFSHLSLFFADDKIPSIISFAIFGIAAGSFFPVAATMFQTMVNREYHGRFFSFRGMMDRILFQIILVSAGFFLDTIGFKNMVLCYGGLSMALVIAFAIRQKRSKTVIENQTSSM
ncbi:MFS transporter [Peribacillus alkalitolerans]|uniref:MFS transporter n=1 Tax=Peribacillus alkalitolerans TaxID=1550385 RepID=UPI0013D3EC7E|nr:MFS transporter [Peribacillus alkalitolerans]